jgi:hypothetical protein
MTAATYDITIEQGADFDLLLTWRDKAGNPIDLTGWSAQMMARENFDDATPLFSLSSPGGGITLGGTSGTVAIHVPAAVTSTLACGQAVYDLKLTDPLGEPMRLIQGNVTIKFAVTR